MKWLARLFRRTSQKSYLKVVWKTSENCLCFGVFLSLLYSFFLLFDCFFCLFVYLLVSLFVCLFVCLFVSAFLNLKVASPMGLATFKRCRHQAESGSYGKWPVPWDLPLLFFLSGKSHGTCHFLMVSTPAESGSYGEWQVPWDLPLLFF